MCEGAAAVISIAPFRAGQTKPVTDLIVGIQNAEFGVPITAADQPDLADIGGFYQVGNGGFWTASVAGEIVGTIALKAFGSGSGALRKMFVAPAWRGKQHGVGAALLTALLAHARARGMSDILLGTIGLFAAACRFYEKNGFAPISAEALPQDFPRMPLDTLFYRLDLAAARA